MYIGKGKARELAERAKRFKADVVVFNNDLSPGQIRELEKVLKIKVLDRSELILDIFATRAKTRQAKLQVELAQLEYTYPRLTKMWTHLERVAGAGGGTAAGAVGGIGTRGPGEQQLEVDRRLVNKRITDLKRELVHIDKRKLREITGRKGKFKVCLVGYTNAGKSTLLNKLTNASVFVEDRLFATLDTRTRKWVLERSVDVLLSDTVGFIRNLPHQLVASFKATLEEAVNADLLLHIADVSNTEVLSQIESVKEVLKEIGCGDKEELLVLNKVDVVKQTGMFEMMQTLFPDGLCISAKKGLGLEELKERVLMKYRGGEILLRVVSRQSDGKVQHFMRACGSVIKETYIDGSVEIEARLGSNQLADLKRLRPVSLEIMRS
jgi:GTP-binding protein HflX